MSTRCQILFRKDDQELLTYKHSDGYPDGVIPLIQEFVEWFPRTNDFEYLTATWFYYVKRERQIQYSDSDIVDVGGLNQPLEFNDPLALGFGISANNKLHRDIEHYYIVDLDDKVVEHYSSPPRFTDEQHTPEDMEQKEPKKTYDLNPDNRPLKAGKPQV